MPTKVRMPKELEERYSRLARETGRPKSYYMNEALSESNDRLEYEYGIKQQVEEFRAGRLKTYSLDEVGEMLDLDD